MLFTCKCNYIEFRVKNVCSLESDFIVHGQNPRRNVTCVKRRELTTTSCGTSLQEKD